MVIGLGSAVAVVEVRSATAGTSSVDVLQVAKMTKAKQHRFVRFLADRGSVAIFGEGDGLAMEKVDLSEVAAQVQECLALRESLT